MENNKKQNYSRTTNTKTSNQTTESNRQKSSLDIQTRHWPRNSRRENSTSARNTNNNSKQLSSKARTNVEKRPRNRGYNGNNSYNAGSSYRCTNEDYFTTGSGLGYGVPTDYDSFMGETVERFEPNGFELNSVCASGSKKQNLNHLLNFYYTPREVDYYDGIGSGGIQRHGHGKKHKYNKEQFLQANFQFVIKASAKRKTNDSPDTLIDWSLIEQINIHTSDEQQCPICLYPPVAAKITRCGHVYCWPCVLHYLSLSDKTWRKCPICYDAIHAGDLKSASIVQQQVLNVNSDITFRLMRRKKGSLYLEKHDGTEIDELLEKYPYVCSPMEVKLFSKFILAKRSDVADILAREKRELQTDVDKSCPEYVFHQQALQLLEERSEKMGEIESKEEEQQHKVEKTRLKINSNNIKQMEIIPNIKQKMENINDTTISSNHEANNEEEILKSSFSNTDSLLPTQCMQTATKFYYFYQSDDGQNIYLHPINVKMLQACYGCLANAPTVISARIIQKEQHSMNEDYRRKFTCLGHLPLTCEFSVVEIDLQPPYVTEGIMQEYKSLLLLRKKERQRRAREEHEREKQINAINDRQMGKLIAKTATLDISSSYEFPMCGFEESLPPAGETDGSDNVPSTSKGGRTKTISTSSAGSCSYSAIAINCKREYTPWSNHNVTQITKPSSDESTNDNGDTSVLNSIQTNLGDVLAQALSQKKESKSTIKTTDANKSNLNPIGGKKKSKKSKKMLPLYSTGMNFGGN